jgi:hypothetical protein
MNRMRKGLLLGALQIVLVLSLAAKLLYDRVTRPRVWVLATVYDPELPIRGRYISERLQMPAEGFTHTESWQHNWNQWPNNRQWAYLEARDGKLFAYAQGSGTGEWVFLQKNNDGTIAAVSDEPVLLFVSDRLELPRLQRGQEIWVEVTVPAKGPPRPIRMGVKKDGVITPLNLD